MITVIPRKITATSVNGVTVANDGSITLPVDSAPTTNSTNLVTSGGVKTELDALSARIGNAENPAQVWTDVSFTIPTSSWSLSNNKYTATAQSSSILATSGVFVNYDNLDNAITPIIAEESTGQVTFTTETIPSGTITGTFRIIDSVNGIVPIARGGTGAATAIAALTNLGAVNKAGDTMTGDLVLTNSDNYPSLLFRCWSDSTNKPSTMIQPYIGGDYAQLRLTQKINDASHWDVFRLPATTDAATSNRLYDIITSKTFKPSAVGIVEDGNAASQTIAAGQYVIWKGVLYTADAAIASGTTLAASGGNKNLTAVSNGGLNALNSKINTINSNSNQVRFSNISSAATGTIESLGVGNSTYGSYFLLMRIDSSNNGAWAGFVRHNASGYQVSEVYKGEHAQTPYVDSNGIVKTSSTTPITVHAYYMRLSAWN